VRLVRPGGQYQKAAAFKLPLSPGMMSLGVFASMPLVKSFVVVVEGRAILIHSIASRGDAVLFRVVSLQPYLFKYDLREANWITNGGAKKDEELLTEYCQSTSSSLWMIVEAGGLAVQLALHLCSLSGATASNSSKVKSPVKIVSNRDL
jgi:hypothetical protein